MSGVTTTKITVSLPADQVAEARRAVADGRASSVSAWVSKALSSQNERQGLRAYLKALIAEYGPPNKGDYRWADDQISELQIVAVAE